jgi:hypothetical protein
MNDATSIIGRKRPGLAGMVGAVALVVPALLVPASSASAAVDPCGVGGNPVMCENALSGAPAAQVVALSPAAGATGVAVTATVTATLSNAPASGTPVLALSGPGGPIAGTSAFDPVALVVAFTPAAALPLSGVVSAVASLGGTPLGGGAWGFTTADTAPPVTSSLFAATDLPAVADWNDPGAVQVGVRITASVAGSVTGVRFFEGPTNTGTHTVNLWSAAGALLATAPSSGESASGWQTVTFAQPVAVTAGQTFTAAYFTTSGLYAATLGGLATPLAVGPLSTPANGGAYVYGTGFPASSSGANYWVDVSFTAA